MIHVGCCCYHVVAIIALLRAIWKYFLSRASSSLRSLYVGPEFQTLKHFKRAFLLFVLRLIISRLLLCLRPDDSSRMGDKKQLAGTDM